MTNHKVKLAWIEDNNKRARSLKQRSVGLIKKVQELIILCGIQACLIMFSPNKVEPLVWPSNEAARGLIDHFYALPEDQKRKKETSLTSYLKKKTKKLNEQLMKSQNNNMNYGICQLMEQLNRGGKIEDLSLSQIYALISFSRDNIMLLRRIPYFVQYPPLRDPLVPPFRVQFENFNTTTNDVVVRDFQGAETTEMTNEVAERISIVTLLGRKNHYLIDQWFSPSDSFDPTIYRQTEININPNHTNYHLFQGGSRNGNPDLEMEPIGTQMMTSHGLFGPVSTPLQHPNMNNNPIMDMSQPRQIPLNYMSEPTTNNDESQFQRSINAIAANSGIRQETHLNGTTLGEGNVDARSFDINRVTSNFENHHL